MTPEEATRFFEKNRLGLEILDANGKLLHSYTPPATRASHPGD
jgi:hypothetical protein